MFRTILVHHQAQLYKLYSAFGICRYRTSGCCVAIATQQPDVSALMVYTHILVPVAYFGCMIIYFLFELETICETQCNLKQNRLHQVCNCKREKWRTWNTSNTLLVILSGICILTLRKYLQEIRCFGKYSPLYVGFIMEVQLHSFLAFRTT